MLGGTTKLGQRKILFIGYAAVLLAAVSCQIVAGLETRRLDPIGTGCALPSGSGPQVRVANFVPTSDVVDVCIRNAGASSWGRPILLNGGLDDDGGAGCADALGAAGFAYTNVSVAFSAPSANVDVKFIPGGSTCSASALAEGDGLSLATNATTTLMYVGGNGVNAQLLALPEADAPSPGGERARFVHVAAGTGPLDFGITADKQPPTTVTVPFFSAPISFGATVPSGTTSTFPSASLEDNGYLDLFEGAFQIGAMLDGDSSSKALFTYALPNQSATYTMYAIGVPNDNVHPLRAWTCDEDPGAVQSNGLLINCVASPLPSISVTMYNPALYGPNSPDFSARRDAVPKQIQQHDADLLCLVEVDEDIDKNNILQQATTTAGGQGPYGYVYQPPTMNLTTQFTDPKDQNGNVPAAPTAPPCNGVDPSKIDALLQCGEQNCSTSTGDPNGKLLSSTDCLVANCPAPFLAVQGQSISCYDCLVVYIASDETWANAQNHCTTETTPPMGFDGASNSMILSKYPLQNTDVLVLPSTFYRRTVLYSQVQLEDQTVDFYCGFLMTTLNATALPYAGSYGGGGADSQTQWDNEQLYEAHQLVDWVSKKSGSNPAIIVGDWRSSQGIAADAGVTALPGTSLPNDLNRQTMDFLQQASGWTFAAPPASDTSWGPQCNFCPQAQDPYNGKSDSYFVNQPILANWPANATTDESLVFTDGVVSLGTDGGLGPASPYYGVNIRVIRPK